MITFTVGNILDSNADAIVNTVNCEGYMGKGIAYQFKLKYPENNVVYEKLCKSGNFKPGDLLIYNESNKTIINFPTKDKWRNKSKYEFIIDGLTTLISKLPNLKIKSIAFPPLGCGNGGLNWNKVKSILIDTLTPFEENFDFIIYEPSTNIKYIKNETRVPKLNTSHLLLMHLKLGLKKFNKTRLQKAAFMVNLFAGENYFKFGAYNFGPYNHTIDILARDIKEYQDYYSLSTIEALKLAENTLISNKTNSKLAKFDKPLNQSINFLNYIETDKRLELITTILYIVDNNQITNKDELPLHFEKWSTEKANRFKKEEIFDELEYLIKSQIIIKSLMEYRINSNLKTLQNL